MDIHAITVEKPEGINVILGQAHFFIVFLRDGYPLSVLNAVKQVPEVCHVICATANPLDVLVAETDHGRGIIGVIDGESPLGVDEDGRGDGRGARSPRALATCTRGRKLLRQGGDQLACSVRNWSGKWKGVNYRLRGRRPDPDATDDVLADRIRSSIGRLEARLDIPHVHVTVQQDGAALLHGEVGTAEQHASAVVRTVLSTFAERIPTDERNQLEAHLPEDVRALIAPPRRTGVAATRIRTVPELVATAAAAAPGEMPPEQRQNVVESVLGALRELVPEETADIAAVLPPELRGFWEAATPR